MPYVSPYIEPIDLHPNAQEYRDPATGAKIWRERKNPHDIPVDSNSKGAVLPPRCTIPDCIYTGQPHTMCRRAPRRRRRCCFPWPRGKKVRFSPRLEVYDPNECNDDYKEEEMDCVEEPWQTPLAYHAEVPAYPVYQDPYWAWQSTTPNWQLPRTPPRDWVHPSNTHQRRQSFTPSVYPVMMPSPQGRPPQNTLVPEGPTYNYQMPPQHMFVPEGLAPRYYMSPQNILVPEVQAFSRWNADRLNPNIPPVMPPNWAPPSGFVSRQVYSTPGRQSPWSPQAWIAHPAPHPNIPDREFWGVSTPADPWSAAQHQAWRPWSGPGGATWVPSHSSPNIMYALTGGHPLPGTDPMWTPTAWRPLEIGLVPAIQIAPYLIPNPRNTYAPQILWDAVQHPTTIKRLTRSGNIVDFVTTYAWKDPATYPSTKVIHVLMQGLHEEWGSVVVENSREVTVGDIFRAVYEYLQLPLTTADVHAILNFPGGDEKMRRIEYACWRRCQVVPALPGFERMQGFKRVDVLEGDTVFWGMWPDYRPDGTWVLNLGFLPARSWECS